MNSSSFRCVLLKSYFPAAFVIAVILLVLDATTPSVVGQVRTVTVTETVRVLVTVTGFVTVTQPVYVTLERTVMVTVATGIPTTLTSVMTSVVTSAVTSILTQTSLMSRLITETSVVSSPVTQTVSVAAPFQIGPLSLDLTDAGGLRFLGYTGGVALASLIGGALATRAHYVSKPVRYVFPHLDTAGTGTLYDEEEDVFVRHVPTAEGSESHTEYEVDGKSYGEPRTAYRLGEFTGGDPDVQPLDTNDRRPKRRKKTP